MFRECDFFLPPTVCFFFLWKKCKIMRLITYFFCQKYNSRIVQISFHNPQKSELNPWKTPKTPKCYLPIDFNAFYKNFEISLKFRGKKNLSTSLISSEIGGSARNKHYVVLLSRKQYLHMQWANLAAPMYIGNHKLYIETKVLIH